MDEAREGNGRSIVRQAVLPSVTAGLVALALLAIVVVVAPRLGSPSGSPFATTPANDGGRNGASLPVPGLFGNGLSVPLPTSTRTPSATSTFAPTPIATAMRSATALPTLAPALLVASMSVSKTTVGAGERFTYEVSVRNVGGRTYSGAFTVRFHTPAGTLACDSTSPSGTCTTPGDYAGTSDNPNDQHVNPAGQTVLATVPAGASRVLVTFDVQAGGLPGSTYQNHAHVDGVGGGKSSVTVHAPDVTTAMAGASGLEAIGAGAGAA